MLLKGKSYDLKGKKTSRRVLLQGKVLEGVVKDGLGCKSGGFYANWRGHEKDL
jgi:hypothetical protein